MKTGATEGGLRKITLRKLPDEVFMQKRVVLELRTHFYIYLFLKEIRKVNHTHCILLFSKRGLGSFRK